MEVFKILTCHFQRYYTFFIYISSFKNTFFLQNLLKILKFCFEMLKILKLNFSFYYVHAIGSFYIKGRIILVDE